MVNVNVNVKLSILNFQLPLPPICQLLSPSLWLYQTP